MAIAGRQPCPLGPRRAGLTQLAVLGSMYWTGHHYEVKSARCRRGTQGRFSVNVWAGTRGDRGFSHLVEGALVQQGPPPIVDEPNFDIDNWDLCIITTTSTNHEIGPHLIKGHVTAIHTVTFSTMMSMCCSKLFLKLSAATCIVCRMGPPTRH